MMNYLNVWVVSGKCCCSKCLDVAKEPATLVRSTSSIMFYALYPIDDVVLWFVLACILTLHAFFHPSHPFSVLNTHFLAQPVKHGGAAVVTDWRVGIVVHWQWKHATSKVSFLYFIKFVPDRWFEEVIGCIRTYVKYKCQV